MTQAAEANQKISRNAAKLAAAIALLVVATVIFGINLRSNDRQAVADPSAKIKVVCKTCGYEFEMPFSDYQKEAPKAPGPTEGLICRKCGDKSVHRVQTRIPPKPLEPGPTGGPSSDQEPPAERPPMGSTD